MHGNLEQVLGAAKAHYAGDRRTAIRLAPPFCRPELFDEPAMKRLTPASGGIIVSGSDGRRRQTSDERPTPTGATEVLSAFQAVVDRTPLVKFGHLTANAALYRETLGATKIHLVDVGIGHGKQWLPWLEGFRGKRAKTTAVRLTGVEVEGAHDQLASVCRVLHARARQIGVPFEFEARTGLIENMTDIDARSDETLAINAGFALHHAPGNDGDRTLSKSRDTVLARLRALSPKIITLVEPDADDHSLPFPERVQEAFRHYGLVFDAFRELLSGDNATRRGLERAFFAGGGPERVGRHGRHAAWTRIMRRHGFAPIDLSDLKRQVVRELDLEDPFSVAVNDGALSLLWKGERILAASAWRCADVLDA